MRNGSKHTCSTSRIRRTCARMHARPTAPAAIFASQAYLTTGRRCSYVSSSRMCTVPPTACTTRGEGARRTHCLHLRGLRCGCVGVNSSPSQPMSERATDKGACPRCEQVCRLFEYSGAGLRVQCDCVWECVTCGRSVHARSGPGRWNLAELGESRSGCCSSYNTWSDCSTSTTLRSSF